MISTLEQFLGRVSRECGEPLYSSLPDSRIAELTISEIDAINNDLNLTGRPWNYQSFVLTVSPGEDYHAITEVGDFTVPFAVETMDKSNPNLTTRVLILVDPVDQVRWRNAGTLAPAGVKHTAVAVTFTEHPEQPGIRAARFSPEPNAQADYTVLYVPNVVRPNSLDAPVTKFPQFENYLQVRVTLAALPYCEWAEFEAAENKQELNANKRAALRGDPGMPGSLAFRFAELKEQFIRQRRQSQQSHIARLTPFGRLRQLGRR